MDEHQKEPINGRLVIHETQVERTAFISGVLTAADYLDERAAQERRRGRLCEAGALSGAAQILRTMRLEPESA